jgi:uncharacterized membrane protein YoaK (UPF0700 family)
MTQEPSHHPSGPLALAVGLAAIAGFVDAYIYVHVTPVFVANMSGNLIHLGVFAGLGDGREAVGSGFALVAFLAGVVGGVLHHDRRLRLVGQVRADALLAIEAMLVLLLPLLMVVLDTRFTAAAGPGDLVLIVIAAFAMGLQATALRRVGEIAVATTYGTGAVVRIGEKIALAARRADRPTNHRRRVTILVLASVLVSYVVGAMIAAFVGSSPAWLLVPGGGLASLAILSRRGGPTDRSVLDDPPISAEL